MALLPILVVLFAVAQSATFTIQIGATNSASFTPTSLTIAPGDTVNFQFQRQGDSVISSSNSDLVCPGGAAPLDASCAQATTPFVNITGPRSGQALFTTPLVFPTEGVFPVVNPTYCQASFAQLACNAKAVITVAAPTQTPAPGATVVVIGVNGTQNVFPSPLIITTGHDVFFRFDILAGLTEVDSSGAVVSGGLSCPVASSVGQFCKWTLTQARPYYYKATPFTFIGRVDAQPNTVIPANSFVVDVGATPFSFTVPAATFPIGTVIYFRFQSYGPYRVRRADGPTCLVFVGSGSFDSLYQEAGRVWPVGITTEGVTYFLDDTFCTSNAMKGQVVATGATGGGDFVDVIVAPRNPFTNITELTYDPNPVVVFQGGSVRWTWTDFGHTVTQSLNNDMNVCLPQPGGFDSGFIQPPVNGIGGTFVQQFNTLGTFYYYCKAHCANSGMRGAVMVLPRPQNIILHGVANDTVNPNRFSPPILSVYVNDTVCWDFQTAGNIVQSEFYRDCIPLAGGFNSGPQPVGARVCRNFTGPSCTAFYYYDEARCGSNAMYGVVLLSDRPAIQVRAASTVFTPVALNVTVGQTVSWNFLAAGNSATQIASLAQVTNADPALRCAKLVGGFDSGVIQNAPLQFNQTFTRPAVIAYMTSPFCAFPTDVPGFFGSINVCDPIVERPTTAPSSTTTTTTTTTPTPTPTPTPAPTCQPTDPCAANTKKTVINFYFADILAGANVGCPTCGRNN